ncbi:MAG: DUF2304 domain-containing protein [Deltaproteobacteria bacterium]|nr:MAG: DUF2304 domain-containing protein [Deltaproteobacteria bacterium]
MNPTTLDAAELREIFLAVAEPNAVRALALTVSLVLVAVVLWLVRRRGLREEYTPIWMGVAFALVVVSIRLDWLHVIARAIGAWTLSSVIFFLGEVFLVAVCLSYAVRLSQADVHIKNLAQEIALLRTRMDSLDDG